MKKLLLDTHTFLWCIEEGNTALGEQAKQLIVDPRNEVYVSAATVWEIAIKRAIGKLEVPDADCPGSGSRTHVGYL